MEKKWERFESFADAQKAEDAYYSSLSPNERVEILLDLVARYGEMYGGSTERFERVFRVAHIKES